MIVQKLSEIQHRHGYLPENELRALSKQIGEPLHRLHEVASFFPHYILQPGPKCDVRVCRDMSCFLRGAERLQRELQAAASEIGGKQISVSGVSCLGQCDHAPAVTVNDYVYWNKSVAEIRYLMETAAGGGDLKRQHAGNTRLPWKIDPYFGREPNYEVVERFVKSRDAAGVLGALKASNLRGMGGARFPTHIKWSAVRDRPHAEKYVVVNGDESEPGTFKDRELLRRAPHLVVEGVIIAGLTVKATRCFIYIRHEFEEEIEAVKREIERAESLGFCGERILGSEFSMPVEVFVSPGGYICGEESALIEAMEDRRAEPRNKPPLMVDEGLYNKPTVINNVETISWVPSILRNSPNWDANTGFDAGGAERYASAGMNGASGMWFVSISGDVKKPGVYEIPFGLTVYDLINHHAGGMLDGQEYLGIAPSGPSGGVLPARIRRELLPPKFVKENLAEDQADYETLFMPLDFTRLQAMDSMLGAAIVILGDKANLVEFARNCAAFFRNESCGKCVPCRMGSQKLVEMLDLLLARKLPRERLKLIEDLSHTMYLTSICGLGQVASNPAATLLKYAPEEVEAYLVD